MYQLYQQYAKAMFNVSYRMMNNREEAEDMLQEAFSEAFNKLHQFRYESTFGAWIKRIVINKCINELKRKQPEIYHEEDMGKYDLLDDSPVNEDEIRYEVNRIRLAMGALPDGYRVVFSLYALEGYDHREIAGILDISESTSKSQYLRAKRKVLEVLKSQEYGR